MANRVTLGIDIGTSSSKGALVGLDGAIHASTQREHTVSRPQTGWAEMDSDIWWREFCEISRELIASTPNCEIVSVGVSGMGPCVLLTDGEDTPLRPAILYGIDTRATTQIDQLTRELGAETIIQRGGSALSTQAVGPKLLWVAHNEPEIWSRSRRFYMPSSWLVRQLTGAYILDHHSASQCTPLYDSVAQKWYSPWSEHIAPAIELPALAWAGDRAGTVTQEAAAATGIPHRTPVICGTIDAWAEAVSVGAQNPGDLMLMYGTTMFLICTTDSFIRNPTLWSTVGALRGTRNLAGGIATSGAITSWLRDLYGGIDYDTLTAEASDSPPGANGLLMLPYFAGERTPIADPLARGLIAGLTLNHTRGDLYRAALEATAFGVRHNIEAIRDAGATIRRIVAVGGGAQSRLWTSIVSDITGLEQVIPEHTIGASYGSAFLAAGIVGDVDITLWNPPREIRSPRLENRDFYNTLWGLYREAYPATTHLSHALAHIQQRSNP